MGNSINFVPNIQAVSNETLYSIVEKTEKAAIKQVLTMCKGNKAHAASLLGISRQGLYKKMNKYGLE